jgi:dihydrodipicolinate synthase/N-acetylneuraminate lyase
MNLPMPDKQILTPLQQGVVIPAHPMALDAQRRLDEQHQRALTRYYLAAGAGGIAIGVHTTQFEIRHPKVNLLEPVLTIATEEVERFTKNTGKEIIKIAGICGRSPQAVAEATLARDLNYHIGLLSLSALQDDSVNELIEHARAVADIIPVMGFYLQPAVGGRILDIDFWRRLMEIENVVAIKIAPFNRYQTLDVVRAVAQAGRAGQVALYTGNDDNIIADLLTTYRIRSGNNTISLRIVGGLLGQWAVWTKRAVEHLQAIHALSGSDKPVPQEWLTRNVELTDANAAIFDSANNFKGCIPGIHEVLRRQGLLKGVWCLYPDQDLSLGQADEIQRVCDDYPHLTDDHFVAAHLDKWLA